MSSIKSTLQKFSICALLSTIIALPTFANQGTTENRQSAVTTTAVEQTQVVAEQNKINLNSATAAELEKGLLAIGAKKAQAIVDYREKNGNFISVEQLSPMSPVSAKRHWKKTVICSACKNNNPTDRLCCGVIFI